MKAQDSTRSFYGRLLTAIGLVLMTAVTVVRADYQTTVLGDTPLLYYSLDSNVANGTATDLTANGNNGNAYNLTIASGPSPYITNAANFDGVDSSIDVAGAPALLNSNGPMTLEAWVLPLTNTGDRALGNIIAKGYVNGNEMTLRDNNQNYTGSLGGPTVSGGNQTTNWTYLVLSADGTNITLYINGVAVQQAADTFGAHNFVDDWSIGTGSPDGQFGTPQRYFNGNMSQVAIYGYGLTAGQVLNHFCMGELGTSSTNSVPIIIAQPQPQTAAFGGTATFSVSAVSALSTTNQWFKNNVALSGQTNAALTLTGVGAGDVANYRVVVGNSNGNTNSVTVSLTVVAANSLKWNPAGTSGVWDTGTTAAWLNVSNSTQTVFNPFDQVLFDDTVGVSNNVTVSGTVSPSLITVNSSTNNYTIGSGTINGSGGLVKKGSSTLTIFNSGTLTGPVTISGGLVYAGNNTFNSAASITITNNATWDIGGANVPGNKPVTVSGIGVNGNGAIYNTFGGASASLNLTLAGDATIGCAPGTIWGLQGNSIVSGNHKLTIKWGSSGDYTEWDGVKFATNSGDMELANGKLGIKNMGSNFGNPTNTFTVDAGTELYFWTSDFGSNGYAKNYHIYGSYAALASFTNLVSNYTLENGSAFTLAYASGNVPLTGTFTLNGVAHLALGDANYIFPNAISGPGGFVWDAYNHQMVLQSSNTYTGPTIIGGGQQVVALTGIGSISHSSLIFFGGSDPTDVQMDVSGRSNQTLTLASGQTLGGIGAINGSLVVSSGATLAPAGTNTTIGITTGANATGTIAANSAVTLNGTTIIKLNGSGVNDQVQAGAGITYGGTLNLVNVSGAPLANGNSFQIANATSYTGSFASITPATPGPNLAWDLSQLNTFGFINVVSTGGSGPVIGSTTVSGGNLIFSGTGGPANGSYAVLTTTNLTTPLASWTSLVTNSFDGAGAFSVTNAISAGTPQLFYRIKQLP